MRTHLIIPDSHAHPDYSNDRYLWLGKLINDVKPDVVVDIGDFFDMPSLCSYDKGRKSFEGRRYRKDLQAGHEAQDIIYHEVRKSKRKLPKFIRTLGNHEHRIERAVEVDAVLEGTIGTKDLLSKEYGWEEHPFLEPVEIDGVNYCHYFVSGVMGRPIGGEHIAYSLVRKQLTSCTQGHSHLFDYAERTTTSGKRLIGCSVGSYFDYHADYAGPANKMWRQGVVVKRNVRDGEYDIEFISLERIRNEYS